MRTKAEIKAEMRQVKDKIHDLKKRGDASNDIKELRQINDELSGLNEQLYKLDLELDEAEERGAAGQSQTQEYDSFRPHTEQTRSTDPAIVANMSGLQTIGTFAYGAGTQTNTRSENHMPELTKEQRENIESRRADLLAGKQVQLTIPETRAIMFSGGSAGSLFAPQLNSDIMIQPFNQVSSIVEVVNSIPLNGGESYKQAFTTSYGIGDYTTEGADYVQADPTFDYVTIDKQKITTYFEISEEVFKLAGQIYDQAAAQNASIAIKRKIAQQIMLGAGPGSSQITGIFNAPANVMPTATGDITITTIDENTLDDLVFGYGGDSESVPGGTFLVLNKKDLAAFAKVRSTTGQKLYNITLNDTDGSGTISSDKSYSVKYVINNAVPALSDSATASGTYCGAYGKGMAYEMPIFSQLNIMESRDYKFRQGQVAYRADIMLGGGVTKYNGFLRIKKG